MMDFPVLPVSSVYVAIFIVLQILFTLRVVAIRRSNRISLGYGDNKLLEQRIRAHANFTEVMPITLIGMVLLEINGVDAFILHTIGVLMVLFRVMHYVAVANKTRLAFRFYGMLGTVLVMLVTAVVLITAVI